MAIAPVLKTGVRKDFWVRIPGPPLPKRHGLAPASRIVVFTLACVLAACESLAPTPESSLARVTALVDPVTIETTPQGGTIFQLPVSLTNIGSDRIFYRGACGYRLEKAELNRWYEVSVSCASIEWMLLTPIDAGATVALTIRHSPSSDFPRLVGKYRVRVPLYFDDQGLMPLPENAGYSRPFQVID